ncbi:hypothetical protein [Acinetobacter brisouii]|uniref:hypothetical protein n=1 Tax=Acinetobacter brisouii TaxID=396323 RepID=UPI00208E6D3A|nr:hypothetical protein [Acinetobacter brisouii]
MSNQPQRLCLVTGTPSGNLQYKVIKKIKFGKGTYGSVTDLYPPFTSNCRKISCRCRDSLSSKPTFWVLALALRPSCDLWNSNPMAITIREQLSTRRWSGTLITDLDCD